MTRWLIRWVKLPTAMLEKYCTSQHWERIWLPMPAASRGAWAMRPSGWAKRLSVILGLIVCAACLADSAWAADRNINVVFIPKSRDQDFWIFMREGVDQAVSEAGNVTLTW